MAITTSLLLPYRLRAVRVGIVAQLTVVAVLVGVLLLDGGEDWNVPAYLLAAGIGGAGIAAVAVLPWRTLFERGLGDAALYVWSAADIALVAVLVGVTGGASSPLWSVFILTSIFFAMSYTPLAQSVLHGLTVASYLGAIALSGTLVLDRDLAVRLMVLSVATAMSSFLAGELMRQMSAHDVAYRHGRRRARQVERVAEVARDIHHLDTGVVLTSIVEAAADLGYDAAGVARLEDGHLTVLDSTGLPAAIHGQRFPIEGSALAAVPTSDRCVISEVDPTGALGVAGFTTIIATPIRVAGEVAAVLAVAGREPPSEADRLTMEPLELLAQVAGRALEHVSSYQAERSAVERLQRLDVLKSDFISNASHELRTPTTVVYGLLQTFAAHEARLEPEVRASILQRLLTASETLKNTVTTLIDFARIESGQLTLKPERVTLAGVVDAVLANLTEALADHDVSVEVAEDLWLDADPVLLDRAVENLLVNASRYTPAGTAVRLRARLQGDEVHVSIADDGPGVPVEEQEHLTDRFFRGGDPNTRTNRGLGLGLAFVHDVVAAHGGRLDIASAPSVGSTFTLVLPQERRTLVLPREEQATGEILPT